MKHINNFIQLEKQNYKAYVRSFLPEYALVPFLHSEKGNPEVLVKEGDTVKEGDVIAREDGTALHAPVPGTITKISECMLPDGNPGNAALIKLKGSFTYLGKKIPGTEWKSLDSRKIFFRIKDGGVINTFFHPVSLASQIENCSLKKNRFLVVRLFDDDPVCETDKFIALNFFREVVQGSLAAAAAMMAEGIVFVVPKKESADFKFERMEFPYAAIVTDDSDYPSGKASSIIKTIKNSDSPDAVRFKRITKESLFIDASTALNVYNAVEYTLPVMEQFVHLTGNCLNAAAMFKVRIGTTIRELSQQCGGFTKEPAKIIINGFMNGSEVNTLDIPVTKSVKSVAFLTKTELCNQNGSPCVRCGRCRDVCPEGLYPDLLFSPQRTDTVIKSAELCSECNLCNSVCPSRLPLSQTISLLREKNEL